MKSTKFTFRVLFFINVLTLFMGIMVGHSLKTESPTNLKLQGSEKPSLITFTKPQTEAYTPNLPNTERDEYGQDKNLKEEYTSECRIGLDGNGYSCYPDATDMAALLSRTYARGYIDSLKGVTPNDVGGKEYIDAYLLSGEYTSKAQNSILYKKGVMDCEEGNVDFETLGVEKEPEEEEEK